MYLAAPIGGRGADLASGQLHFSAAVSLPGQGLDLLVILRSSLEGSKQRSQDSATMTTRSAMEGAGCICK